MTINFIIGIFGFTWLFFMAIMWSEKNIEGAVITTALCGAIIFPFAFCTPSTADTDTAVYDKWTIKVDAHSWYDEESSTLYVDSQWNSTVLDMADDIAALHDADFDAKYEAAVRETLSNEEFAAWQASQEAQRDVIFTLTNGRIRYDVRHVVDVETGDVIR